jgi:hypothetical protein
MNDGPVVTTNKEAPAITNDALASHRGFSRVFQPGQLTFGFIAPLEGNPDSPAPNTEVRV